MKSYSLELVQRGGSFGRLAGLALLGAGVYYGYKKLVKDKANTASSAGAGDGAYDAEAHEGEDFTSKILKAAKRIIN